MTIFAATANERRTKKLKLTLEIPDNSTRLSVDIWVKSGLTYTIYSEMIDEDEVRDGSTVKLPMEEK